MKLRNIKIVFIVFVLLNVIGFAFFSVAEERAESNLTIFQDSDRDGLSDDEERIYGTDPNNADSDGDGYTDGVEVKSGYDPLKPAPGDRVVSNENAENGGLSGGRASGVSAPVERGGMADTESLTRELSKKISSLVQGAAQGNQQIGMEQIDEIVSTLPLKGISESDLAPIDPATIKVKTPDYSSLSDEERRAKEKEDALEYLSSASYVMLNNAPKKITTKAELDNVVRQYGDHFETFASTLSNPQAFGDLFVSASKAYGEMTSVEVPEQYIGLHTKGLSMLNTGSALEEEMSGMNLSDPVEMIVRLAKIQGFASMASDYGMEVERAFSTMGIADVPLILR